jgi:hypothetical protein
VFKTAGHTAGPVIVNLSSIREESGLLVETTRRRPVFPRAKALLR